MDLLEVGRRVLDVEAQAILGLKEKMGGPFLKVVDLIHACTGKVILTGMGKSGLIAQKISATLSSTGTPSFFLHPAEGLHGDMGAVSPNDLIWAFSYGGESAELMAISASAKKRGVPVILTTGNLQSDLAQGADLVLDIKVQKEACPIGLAPTASSTATLALGDAIAMAVHSKRGFTAEHFAANHPGGGLGFKLTRIRDLMHTGPAIPVLPAKATMAQVLSVMSRGETRGAAGILDDAGDLAGVITDGDIRRRLDHHEDPLQGTAGDLMTKNPKTIDADELAQKALFLLEQFPINVLFVLDKQSDHPRRPVGVVHVQDLVRARLR